MECTEGSVTKFKNKMQPELMSKFRSKGQSKRKKDGLGVVEKQSDLKPAEPSWVRGRAQKKQVERRDAQRQVRSERLRQKKRKQVNAPGVRDQDHPGKRQGL